MGPGVGISTGHVEEPLAEGVPANGETPLPPDTANPAAQSSEEYTIVQPTSRRPNKGIEVVDDDGPLVDTTAALAKNSKKTKRLQKQAQKRQQKVAARARPHSYLDLPAELLQEVLACLRPSDLFRMTMVNRATNDFINLHERFIAQDILNSRYWILQQCFPLPEELQHVDVDTASALRDPRRQKMTEIHKKPYQHIKPPDSDKLCTCPFCLLAWNNLNVVLDMAHFQSSLNHREPIPIIARGTNPAWNVELTEAHAKTVERAISDPLAYAAILEIHLNTITGTLLRQYRFPPRMPMHRHNKAPLGKTVHPSILYHLTERDAAKGTDQFLERAGKPSYEFPFSRDNYYSLLAYVPYRKWGTEQERWIYYAAGGHERDLEWIRRWFVPRQDKEGREEPQVTSTNSAAKDSEKWGQILVKPF
ncbi:hypothetical protein BAUCODRAFT_63068 [Baudoinia panamericana UAMH 10762]|uniref:F-box domain-containing protein n=1 Tax=Baudoinia panamericana (strain UAMH 10762) TaxID=717646 RepID=M2MTR3_BAUPA|nr:uncharacterized protein BAUCODRAFT_63068 [Baudoinia panamericana UAMH 10762]EMD00307.1 hypothetical protein BAUCODRAFT_63068 [Baudoinia panamericana UAMH 10762]